MTLMRPPTVLVLALTLLPALAGAQTKGSPPALAAVRGPVTVLEGLPPRLGAFQRDGGVTDFEGRPGGAGLGAAAQYNEADTRASATVYVYDRGRHAMADGAETPVVTEELGIAAAEIDGAARNNRYRVLDRGPGLRIAGRAGTAMRCDRYSLQQPGGTVQDSHACVGVLRGQVVKLRVSVPRRGQAWATDPLVEAFGQAAVTALGG